MDKRNKDLLSIYRSMYTSKISDDIEAELVNSGEANFLASSRGHEGAAIINPYLKQEDWLCCHYRDKALMLARGVSNESFFYSAMCKDQSHSHGRQMVSHMSAPELNITSIVAPVGNNALHAAGIAHTVKDDSENPVVLCSMGDGTTQQGEVYEGLTEASRNKLPVLFFIHNNFLAISTKTQGQTFFALGQGIFPKGFLDIPITRIDGKQPLKAYEQIGKIINNMREKQTPHIIVFNVDRLSNHSNADNQSLYRGDIELSTAETRNDPVKNARQYLLDQGIIKEIKPIRLWIKQDKGMILKPFIMLLVLCLSIYVQKQMNIGGMKTQMKDLACYRLCEGFFIIV
jgi:2-oxoisovalerate dehydrogenase E1 component